MDGFGNYYTVTTKTWKNKYDMCSLVSETKMLLLVTYVSICILSAAISHENRKRRKKRKGVKGVGESNRVLCSNKSKGTTGSRRVRVWSIQGNWNQKGLSR